MGGPDPADTPTNGGSRGAAPPGNLGIRTGQRPMIHRLQRCRGPRGPRASVTPAHRNSPRFAKKHGSRRHSWGGRLPPFLRRGSHKCGSPQRHQSQRGCLPGMEGCVCRKLPPWPPHHPRFGGGEDLDLLHSYIYSPAAAGGTRFTRAFVCPPVGPGAPPLYGGPGRGSDFPYKVGHPGLARGPVNAVFVHPTPLFRLFVPPLCPAPSLCCPVLCLFPLPLVSVPTPPTTPIHPDHPCRPNNAPCFTAASPGLYPDLYPDLYRDSPRAFT